MGSLWSDYQIPNPPNGKTPLTFSQQLPNLRFLELFLPTAWARPKISQHMKPIISKGHSSAVFWIFHQIFFLAFNSRDNTMLWLLNLFSRSSSTKLWKRIFKKMSQKNFLTLKVGKWWDCLILTPWERSNLSQRFRWKLFSTKFFYVL